MVAPNALADSNRLGMQFLHIELSLAHTFLDSADISQQMVRQQRSRQDAEMAYRSVLKYMGRVRFTRAERQDFDERLEILRQRLVRAGIEKTADTNRLLAVFEQSEQENP